MQTLGNILQIVASFLLLVSYLPQIVQLIKTKRSEDISVKFWVILTLGLCGISINMAISGVGVLILSTQVLNTILSGITLLLVVRYKEDK